jgi:hypothetical protein
VLCCAVLCCAVLCCAVLCCAVLCCATHLIPPSKGAIYHLKYKPPPPEVVDRLVQRSDDTEEKVRGTTAGYNCLYNKRRVEKSCRSRVA